MYQHGAAFLYYVEPERFRTAGLPELRWLHWDDAANLGYLHSYAEESNGGPAF